MRIAAAWVLPALAWALTATAAPPPAEHFFRDASMAHSQLSPDGWKVAMTVASAGARARLAVLDLRTRQPKIVASFDDVDVGHFAWVNDQRLVLQMQGRLARERLRLEGTSRRLRHPGERLRQQAQRLDDLDMRLRRAFNQQLANQRERLARLDARLAAQHPGRGLALLRQRLDGLAARLPRAMQGQLRSQRQQLAALAGQLQIVSPLATLGRGYSILLDERGHAVRSAAQTRPGQRLKARLSEGELDVRVEDNHVQPATLSLLD